MNRIQPARGELPGSENITRTQFSNGLTVLVHTNPDSLSVVVTGYLLAGALYDQDEQLGLSHFTSLSLMRGTHSRSFHQIYSGLENRGASLGFGARIHTVSFSGRALAEDLPYLMQLLSDVIRNPAFPPAHIEKLRSQFLTSLAIRAQDTSEMASLGFNRMLYPNHPYGRPEDGYPETIQAITRQDLSLFHANHYGPRGTVIALVGPISADEGITLISKHFDDWTNEDQTGESALPDLKPINHSQRQHIPIPGKTQLDLVMGSAGPSRGSEDYYAAMVGNNILGQFGMMGRIGASVRVKSGLAYYAYSSLNAGVGPGSWEIIAGTNPSNIDQTIHLIRSEIQRFTNKPVLKGELADVKSNLVGRLPLAFESNGGVASALINMERYKLGLDYYQQFEGIIKSITPEAILEVAKQYFHPEWLLISTAGTVET